MVEKQSIHTTVVKQSFLWDRQLILCDTLILAEFIIVNKATKNLRKTISLEKDAKPRFSLLLCLGSNILQSFLYNSSVLVRPVTSWVSLSILALHLLEDTLQFEKVELYQVKKLCNIHYNVTNHWLPCLFTDALATKRMRPWQKNLGKLDNLIKHNLPHDYSILQIASIRLKMTKEGRRVCRLVFFLVYKQLKQWRLSQQPMILGPNWSRAALIFSHPLAFQDILRFHVVSSCDQW